MSQRYVKVEDAEIVESNNSTALTIFIISLLALAIIAMAVWQPWASTTPQTNSTTIIKEREVKDPDSQRPIIVNPPSSGASDTNVTIHNELPKSDKSDSSTTAGGSSSDTTNKDDNQSSSDTNSESVDQ